MTAPRSGTPTAGAGPGGTPRSPRSGRRVYALITGGGTGGHVIPALAIAQALVARGHEIDRIHFVGARRGMEGDLVPPAGFTITLLPGRGIARRLTLDNVGAIFGSITAFFGALWLVGRMRPRVVVSVGGFASAPCVLAAWVWRVPLVVAEQNAVPGLVNRLAARVAAVAAVSFPGTALPRAVVTGNPVRPEMVAIDRRAPARAAARRRLGFEAQTRVIVVAGGSLGARRLNVATVDLARMWAARPGVAIHHVVGARDWDLLPGPVGAPQIEEGTGGLAYRRVRFEDHMEVVYAAAEVAVHRAGASTVAELAAAGVPAVLIPLPGAPGDHQTANAARLADAGAAVILADQDLDGARLAEVLDRLLGDPDRLEAMGVAARTFARPGAADDVAALAERSARA